MEKQHVYSWIPDLPDNRDFLFSELHAAATEALPESVDLRQFCSKVETQGELGSCTANASVGALEFLENKDGVAYEDLSRLFTYYNSRRLQGTIRYDSGASLRATVKSLAKYGTCSEDDWPYIPGKFRIMPTKSCYNDALNHTVTAYAKIYSLQDMKKCLAAGYPFVIGLALYSSFESEKVAVSGIVNMPTRRESMLGGHAVLVVGYDDKSQRFIVRNSWGEDWGQRGYFTIPYKYLSNSNLAGDAWTIRKGKNF